MGSYSFGGSIIEKPKEAVASRFYIPVHCLRYVNRRAEKLKRLISLTETKRDKLVYDHERIMRDCYGDDWRLAIGWKDEYDYIG